MKTEMQILYNSRTNDLFAEIYDASKGENRFIQDKTACYSHVGQHSEGVKAYSDESTAWLPDKVVEDAQNLVNELKSIYGEITLINNFNHLKA